MDKPAADRLDRLAWVIWVLLVIGLPVTSFPHFPRFILRTGALVLPLSMYPLALLFPLLVIRDFRKGIRYAKVFYPLIAFVLIACLSTGIAGVYPEETLRGETTTSRAWRALATLAIGLGFFYATVRMNSTQERVQSSLRWLTGAMGVTLLWSLLQSSRLIFNWPPFQLLNPLQQTLSVRQIHLHRVIGFAYEPSWYADQLVLLVFPFLIAGLLTGYRIYPWRRWGWPLQWALLAVSILVMIMTYSRGGIITLILSAGIPLMVLAIQGRERLVNWFVHRKPRDQEGPAWRLRPLRMLMAIGLIVLGSAIFWELGSRQQYFTLLWDRLDRIDNLFDYLLGIGVGPRLALAEAAWGVFQDHPWLGAGLGQSGFEMLERIPFWSYDRRSEIIIMLSPGSALFPNPKNLWVRLLAETGFFGGFMMGFFLLMLFVGALSRVRDQHKFTRFMGIAGIIGLIAVILEGLSLDSFALPTMWIFLGLVTASFDLDERDPP